MEISYHPPGAVAAAFHKSNKFVRGIMGCFGSGKSSTCCFEILLRGLAQAPYNGVRKSRWAAIRNTYPELKTTTIKTWQDWFGDISSIKWDTPISSKIYIKDIGDGTALEIEVLFLALDRPEDIGKLKSLELTGAWMNEASELPYDILSVLTARVGRYPSKRNGGYTWTGIILDTNPPDDDHWWYKQAEEEKHDDWEFFRQPGGLYKSKDGYHPNPLAENIHNLPGGYQYYLNQIAGKTEDWIKVFILAEYGSTMSGKPVYPEYNDKIHYSENELKPIMGLPIMAAFDFGLTPACVFGQMTPKGQLIILKELVSEDMGIRQFYTEVVRPVIVNEYRNFRIDAVGDPAGNIRAQTDEKTCMQELLELGLPCEPAITNEFIARRESVAFFLTRLAGGAASFLLDPSCKMLRKSFNGGYRYERVQASGNRYKDRPVKDKFSHISDALQYLCLQMRSGMNPVRAKEIKKKSAGGWS